MNIQCYLEVSCCPGGRCQCWVWSPENTIATHFYICVNDIAAAGQGHNVLMQYTAYYIHIHLVSCEGRGDVQGGHVAGAGHARAVLVDILDTCQHPGVTIFSGYQIILGKTKVLNVDFSKL